MLMLPVGAFCYRNYSPLSSFTDIFLPYLIIPLIIFFNMGNLLRVFPESLRRNNKLFFKIKAIIILVAFFEPAIIQYTIANLR